MEGFRIPAAALLSVAVPTISTIHRDKDTYVAFGRKNASRLHGWENLGSIKVRDIENLLPGMAEYLFKDAYFSVNGFYHPAPERREGVLNLPYTIRKQSLLQRLNCCYADLDVGREGVGHPQNMDTIKAQSRVFAMMLAGILPNASIVVLTGRGLNLHWILKDENDPTMPPRAWPEKVARWKQVNQVLSQRLRDFAVDDSVSRDPVRVFRVPGSINTNTNAKVNYMLHYDEKGIITHTLEELAAFLGVPSVKGRRLEWHRQTKARGSVPNRRRGYEALNGKRLDDLLTIQQARGGFLKRGLRYTDGTASTGRLKALTIYAITLRRADAPKDEALSCVTLMAENCRPPYPSDPNDIKLKALVDRIYSEKNQPWKNETICAQLGISYEMAKALELQTIMPEELRRERKAEKPTRAKTMAERRAVVKFLFNERKVRSCRLLVAALAGRGIIASPQTVSTDLQVLGLTSTNRGGRPKKNLDQPALFQPEKQQDTAGNELLAAAQEKLLKRRELGKQNAPVLGQNASGE